MYTRWQWYFYIKRLAVSTTTSQFCVTDINHINHVPGDMIANSEQYSSIMKNETFNVHNSEH